jgi:hypothetical protein
MFSGFGSCLWSLLLALIGAFYGVLGAVYLGVKLDRLLTAGALCLLVQCIPIKSQLSDPSRSD